jgi:hypothetical protein
MNSTDIRRVFDDTAYVRVGGSAEEKRCAEYLVNHLAQKGLNATLEPFEVDMAAIREATLTVDGVDIPCKGYLGAGTHTVEAPFVYLRGTDAFSLNQVKGCIVMIEGGLRYWMFRDLIKAGAVGFITFAGDIYYADEDIDQRELRAYISQGEYLPGVHINVKQAVRLIEKGAQTARIHLVQDQWKGESQNVRLDLSGEMDEWIVLTAHYDSTALSVGAYDNMTGSIALLSLAERFSKQNTRYGLRFLWCGSEERGLLGSKAYTEKEEELKNIVLCVNIDMIGSLMGGFIACATAEEKLMHYVQYMSQIKGFGVRARQDVYSSDSTPFADKGIPAISFARLTPAGTSNIHSRYDSQLVLSMDNMVADIDFIGDFVDTMANAAQCPVAREMPDNMKEKLDIYLNRKRNT